MEEMLTLTECAVRADSYSSRMLWVENRTHFDPKHIRTWEQINFGFSPTIDYVKLTNSEYTDEEYPICVELFWAEVSSKLILFYHCCSMVSHYAIVEEWIDKMCPNKKHKTDAMNFYTCFRD
jgi:hypothetical protein